MQLSLDPERDPNKLTITLTDNKVQGGYDLQATVTNRGGGVLASMGSHLAGDEVEITPQMLHLMALGWLYLDAKAIIGEAKALLSEHRKRQRSLKTA